MPTILTFLLTIVGVMAALYVAARVTRVMDDRRILADRRREVARLVRIHAQIERERRGKTILRESGKRPVNDNSPARTIPRSSATDPIL